jgi:hypothetical protein
MCRVIGACRNRPSKWIVTFATLLLAHVCGGCALPWLLGIPQSKDVSKDPKYSGGWKVGETYVLLEGVYLNERSELVPPTDLDQRPGADYGIPENRPVLPRVAQYDPNIHADPYRIVGTVPAETRFRLDKIVRYLRSDNDMLLFKATLAPGTSSQKKVDVGALSTSAGGWQPRSPSPRLIRALTDSDP